MKSVCVATTSPLIVGFFLVPHLQTLRADYQVTLVVNTEEPSPLPADLGVEVVHVAIERKIRLLRDLSALWTLTRLFAARRFDVVHSFGPKAGLLCSMAAFMAGVPNRVHTFTGQVWMTRKGLSRAILKFADRLTAAFTTRLLTDSWSQRDILIEQGVVDAEKCGVLGAGSISGVDTNRFRPSAETRARIRAQLELDEASVVFLFLGRFTVDKGVLDLARAFAAVAHGGGPPSGSTPTRCALLIVGVDEENLRPQLTSICGSTSSLRFVEFTRKPEDYIAAADVLCLPSYREGFGSVVIEAAAAGIPAIGSDIYGVRDAIVDGSTGTLFEPGDITQLTAHMQRMLEDADFRRSLGRRAMERAQEEFSQQRIMQAVTGFYAQMLGSREPAAPPG